MAFYQQMIIYIIDSCKRLARALLSWVFIQNEQKVDKLNWREVLIIYIQ